MKLFGYLDDAINMIINGSSWAKWFVFGLTVAFLIWFAIEYRRRYA
jgi:hypothetical protein